LEIVPNTFYHHLRQMKLVFDGKYAEGITLELEPASMLQRFALDPPRKGNGYGVPVLLALTAGRAE
jgi:hypothetical protein